LETPFITLLPPMLSLLTGLSLAVLSLVRARETGENLLFSLVCIWISMLSPVFILQHFVTEEAILLRIDRSVHFFYVYLPPIFIAFLHRMVNLHRPLITSGAFSLSLLISASTRSDAYIAGLHSYSWGSIARGGPMFTLFGVYCGFVLLYSIGILAADLRREANPIVLLRKKYVLLSFIAAGILTLGNLPSINGVDVYPTGNFMFIPLSVMAYGVLKYRLMDIPGFFLNLLFWAALTACIALPNIILFLLAYPAVADSDAAVLAFLLLLWFLVNHLYIKRLQSVLDPVFHRSRTGLMNAETRFLESILLLRNRDELIRKFSAALHETLQIQEIQLYEKDEKEHSYAGPGGRRLVLPSAVRSGFLAAPHPVQRSLVEASPQESPERRVLLGCFRGTGARYLLPLVADDDLIGLFFLGPKADGREIRPDEAGFLKNITPVLSTAISNATLYQSVSDLKDALEERTNALGREMAERIQAEEERRKSDEKYRIVAERVTDVIWIMDPETGRFTYISPSVRRLLGYSAEEMATVPLQKILTPEALEKSMRILAEETAREASGDADPERSGTFELDHVPRNGPAFPAEVTTSFLRDASGRITGVLGVTRDVRERKRLESQLRTARKMEAIGTLAGGVAHDLNNILSGVTSYPELLLVDLPDESPLKEPIRTIQKSGEKAAAIVQDLLTLSRRGAAVKEVLDLNHLITDYLDSPEFQLLQAYHPRIEVACELDPALPCIDASRIHIQKSVMNLVSNAAEAMPDGGHIRIRTESTSSPFGEPGVTLEVSDSGLGMAPEDLERIFEPFYTKKEMGRSGTGLGMAVVWGVIQDHDGTIDIDSRPGEGATFTVRLPAVEGTAADERPAASLEALTGDGETILVVDDVPEQREIASQILRRLNYRVETAASGEEAVDRLRTDAPDLLLLDMIMEPGMDGLATYRRILDLHPMQKAVPVSGFSETHQVREVLKLGAGRYVRKPYTLESIGRAVKEELAKP